MWFLQNLRKNLAAGEPRLYHIRSDKSYVVGRDSSLSSHQGILIYNDTSVSRRHCNLAIHQAEGSEALTKSARLHIQDKSKYGVFVNDKKINKEITTELIEGLIVKFGIGNSSFKVTSLPLIVTTTGEVDKNDVSKCVQLLCGQIVAKWQKNCTLLVATKFDITLQVLKCLVSQKQIVTPVYLKTLLQFDSGNEIPSADDYLPSHSPPGFDRNIFRPLNSRKTVFSNKIFMCLDMEQMIKLSDLICSAGGRCELFLPDTQSDLKSLATMCIVISPSKSLAKANSKILSLKKTVQFLLQSHQKRLILEKEIGLAILYSSTEKYCNPEFLGSVEVTVSANSPSNSSTSSTISESSLMIDESIYEKNSEVQKKLPESLSADVGKEILLKNNSKSSQSNFCLLQSDSSVSAMKYEEIPEMESKKAFSPELPETDMLYGFKSVPKKRGRDINDGNDLDDLEVPSHSTMMKVGFAKLVTKVADQSYDRKDSPNFKKFKKAGHYKWSTSNHYTYFADCGLKGLKSNVGTKQPPSSWVSDSPAQGDFDWDV